MGSFEDRRESGIVFNIQKYCVHDGPGIRTMIFLKGCPLSCRWCSNPESQLSSPELAYNQGRCLTIAKCFHCIKACTRGAIAQTEHLHLNIDRKLCKGCAMPCAEKCPSQALTVYGKKMTVDEILEEVEKEAVFYAHSRGGLTVSGGEPLMQPEVSIALLREAKRRHLHTCIETSGFIPWNTLKEAVNYLDVVIYDFKHTDSYTHRDWTGMDNRLCFENFRRLAETFPDKEIIARTPVIPGFNDTEEIIEKIADFIQRYSNVRYELLPYHRFGSQKYAFLGRENLMGEISLPRDTLIRLNVTTGGVILKN